MKAWERGVYVIMIIENFIALATNTFLFVLLYRTRSDWKKLGFGFIFILASADFINALHRIPVNFLDMGRNENLFINLPWFCPVFLTLSVAAPYIASLSAAMLSAERLFVVCYSRAMPKKIGWPLYLFLLLIFLIPASVAFGEMILSPIPPDSLCTIEMGIGRRIRNHLYYSLLSILLTILTVCYVRIFLTTRRNVMAFQGSNNSSKPRHSITRTIALRVFIFLGFYLFCYIPSVASFAIHMNSPRIYIQPLEIFTLLANNLISLIDPGLVLFLHRRYRQEFLLVINESKLLSKWLDPPAYVSNSM